MRRYAGWRRLLTLMKHAPKKGRPRNEDRARSLEATKPWLEIGISRRTWYRRQAEPREKTWYTYLAIHPFTKVPAYVGVTADMARRRTEHAAPHARLHRLLLRKKGALWGFAPEVVVVGVLQKPKAGAGP
jgi:hypothetical protein